MERRMIAQKSPFKLPTKKPVSKPNVFKLLDQGKGGNPQGGNPAKGGEDPQKLIPGIKPGDPIPGKDPSQYNEPTYNEGKTEDPMYEQISGGTPWGWIIGGILGVGALGYFAFGKKKKKRK